MSLVNIKPFQFKHTPSKQTDTPVKSKAGDRLKSLTTAYDVGEKRRKNIVAKIKELETTPSLTFGRSKDNPLGTPMVMHDKPNTWFGEVLKPWHKQVKTNPGVWNKKISETPGLRDSLAKFFPKINTKALNESGEVTAKYALQDMDKESLYHYMKGSGQDPKLIESLTGFDEHTPVKDALEKGEKFFDRFQSKRKKGDVTEALLEGYRDFNPSNVKVSENLASLQSDSPLKLAYKPLKADGTEVEEVVKDGGISLPLVSQYKTAKQMGNVGKGGTLQQMGFQTNPKYWGKGLAKTLNPAKQGLFHNLANAPGGLLKGMTPLGWSLMALELLGKIAKPHTFFGKLFS